VITRLDVLNQEHAQRFRGSVGQWDHPAAPEADWLLALDGDADQYLLAVLARPARASWLLAADVGLIDLDVAP